MDKENRATPEASRLAVMEAGELDPMLMKVAETSRQGYSNLQRALLATVLLFGMSSVVLGLVAEFYNITDSEVVIIAGECVYGGHLGVTLSVAAAVALTVAQVLVTLTACNQGFPSNSPASKKEAYGLRFLFFSWFTWFLATYRFTAGIIARTGNEDHQFSRDGGRCEVVRQLVYLKGSALAALVVVNHLAYCRHLFEARAMAKASSTGIKMNYDLPINRG